MAIQAAGEFEIIANGIIMKLNRRLTDQPNNTVLVSAKRQLEEAIAWANRGQKLTDKQLKTFSDASENIRQNFTHDSELSDKLFDLLDFLEYRLG